MFRRSSSQSSNPAAAATSLHPTLQAALGSLDVQLEEELIRYRRYKAGKTPRPSRNLDQNTARQLDLITVGATGGRTQPDPSVSQSAPSPVAPPPSAAQAPAPHAAQPQSSRPASPQPEVVQAASVQAGAPLAVREAVAGASTTANPGTNTAVSGATEQDPSAQGPSLQGPSLQGPSAANLAVAPGLQPEAALAHPDDSAMGPDDYMESSEELLRSLADEEAELRAERGPGFVESLLTPLGVGSMLLILLSSITLGYVIMNPASLSFLGLENLFNREPSDPQPQEPATEPDRSSGPGRPVSPDLTAQEFVDLNLNTLGTLSVRQTESLPAASPAASPTASPTPESSANATQTATPSTSALTTLPAPAPVPQVAQPQQPPVAVAPAPQPAPPPRPAPVPQAAPAPQPAPPPQAAPAPVAAAPSSDPNYYYVITNYSGDRSLDQAREAVGDAYVRNFPSGARVQLGAFSDPNGAQEMLQNLESQGISAEIYQP